MRHWRNVPAIRICCITSGGPAAFFPSVPSTLSSVHTPTPRALIRPWGRITLCCGRCPKPRRNSAKRCISVRKSLGCTWNWGWSTPAPRVGTKMQPGNAEAAYRLGAALLQQGKVHEARQELARADQLKPDMPETLYSLGKAASLDADLPLAEKSWTRLITLEKETSLAAQAHFGLASLYRKQGKTSEDQREMQEFKRLQSAIEPPRSRPK